MNVAVLSHPLLDGTAHGFLGRVGGVSTGLYGGLNVGLGSADDLAAVQQNRARAVEAVLPGAALATVYQVHGKRCVTIHSPFADGDRPEADALATATPGLLLGILTADCVPVLFADHKAGVVAAAHAGWKGALAGVTDSAIEAMEALGADRRNIHAVTGPSIQQESYEVTGAMMDQFDPADHHFFAPGREDHYQFDVEGYVLARLHRADIGAAERMHVDTYALEDRYFSFRRSTHRSEPDYGRQISLIGLRL